ncbi:MAG: hypothetical protein Q4F95_07435 [Oscillospiraceae bacterium]|nr:hypothetical protein [Oscillospiraceae bacterium]
MPNDTTVLNLLKIDLGISHTARDAYLNNKIAGCQEELRDKGITLDLTKADDVMLLSDYTAWQYRHRAENIPLSKSLDLRIKNAVTKERANQ